MTKSMSWTGVLPALTTPFKANLAVDAVALARHVRWMFESGCTGVVALGSLGEGATLRDDEKIEILRVCVKAAKGRGPVVAGISSLSTEGAVALARAAASCGCQGLMVLPPYVYTGDAQEMEAHVSAVISATGLSCMLYNNPLAYRTDFLPDRVAALARIHPNLHAVKESSGDIRRVTAIRALIAQRLDLLVGVDDLIVEGIAAGATGWIAGLVNAFPVESVRLFELARAGQYREADRLYRWFLPLLRMDTGVKFVQLIKLVQQEVGRGHERVRPPRLMLKGTERSEALSILRTALKTRPAAGGAA